MSFGNFKLQISFSGSDELQFMSILIKLIIIYFNLSTKMTSLPVSLSLSLSLSLSPSPSNTQTTARRKQAFSYVLIEPITFCYTNC